MKHALLAALILLAGCAAEQERGEKAEIAYAPGAGPVEQPIRQPAPPGAQPVPADDAKAKERGAPEAKREGGLRSERQTYAEGLERILVANGVSARVVVYEGGQGGPGSQTPMLMFVGPFSTSFVQRALTAGAVLERARNLGFRSVEFFDSAPGGHYQFELSKTGPLPRCAVNNRLCL
jgi:hypothetical protein